MTERYRPFRDKAAHAAFFNGRGDWGGPGLYNKATGYMMDRPQRGGELCAPMLAPRFQEYRSPVSDRWISDRAERREDLKRTGCIEVDPPKKKFAYRNAEWCKKHGRLLDPEHTKTGTPFPERELAARGIDPDTVKNERAKKSAALAARRRADRVAGVIDIVKEGRMTRRDAAKALEYERITPRMIEEHNDRAK